MQFLTTNCFWTEPPSGDSTNPTDPLGFDSMRTQLADKLVPCLTGRVSRHEDFFWALCFIKWAACEKDDESRVESFLRNERLLKLWWSHKGLNGFSGTEKAHSQAETCGEPKMCGPALLDHPRAQGLLGAHLGPLREMGLVQKGVIALSGQGTRIIEGTGKESIDFAEGDWNALERAFSTVKQHYTPRFKREIRESLKSKMPDLNNALSINGWEVEPQKWRSAARNIGASLSKYATLAGEFCRWAYEVRNIFDLVTENSGAMPRGLRLPARLGSLIPDDEDLAAFGPLKKALAKWERGSAGAVRTLSQMHADVFKSRGYDTADFWLLWEDSRPVVRRHLLPVSKSSSDSDCRWSNAVLLMRPQG